VRTARNTRAMQAMLHAARAFVGAVPATFRSFVHATTPARCLAAWLPTVSRQHQHCAPEAQRTRSMRASCVLSELARNRRMLRTTDAPHAAALLRGAHASMLQV
jgi:hypothetical protein